MNTLHAKYDGNLYYGEAAYRTMRDSGGTFLLNGHPVYLGDRQGYMVGGIVPTRIEAVGQYPYHVALGDVLRDFVRDNARETVRRSGEGATNNLYLGTWVHDGKVYIDLSEWVEGKAEAVALAQSRGELAIWDCYAGNEVSTGVD